MDGERAERLSRAGKAGGWRGGKTRVRRRSVFPRSRVRVVYRLAE